MVKKFRFYDKEHKQWRELPDLFGDYQAHAFRTYGEGFELRHFLNAEAQEKILSGDLVIQQWTGLLDKNGREIYEGDIVSYEAGEPNRNDGSFYRGMSEVKFKNGAFWPRPIKEECEDSWYDYELRDLEIIGNIFENPLDNRSNKD